MDRLQRIYKLHQAVSSRRHPVSCQTLQDELECSRATVKRIIQEMRLYFNAPIEYDRSRNGYHYALSGGQSFELPGLWFSATELYALLTTQQLLAHVQPGLLDTQLKPVRERRMRKCFSRLSPLPFTGETAVANFFARIEPHEPGCSFCRLG